MSETIRLTAVKKRSRVLPRWTSVALVFPVLVGLLAWITPLGPAVENLSYDILFRFKPVVHPESVVIIYLDERSYGELRQRPRDFDRSLYARLLERLTQDQARLVVFDIWFRDSGVAAADEDLARAIRQSGCVVLSATPAWDAQPGLDALSVQMPIDLLREATTNWGIAAVVGNLPNIVRQCFPSCELGPNLPMATAMASGSTVVEQPGDWLNYYGPQGTIPHVSLCDVTNQVAGFFRNKVVFVGDRPTTLYHGDHLEEFRTPYSRWGGDNFPGVEILATGYLNLAQGEGLYRMPGAWQLLGLVGFGLGLGWSSGWLRVRYAALVAVASGLVVFCLALALHWGSHVWFCWFIVAAIQAPATMAWSLGRMLVKARHLPALSPFFSHDGKHRIPNVPDHVLLGRIGVGAYGEVWLARNTIGIFRAVKFVFRDRYPTLDPYQREFRGIEKYMPVSLGHPGLVHVLHVGRNDDGGYFFYIMEIGDDEVCGQNIDPATYSAKNLSHELTKRGRFPVSECVDLGIKLATALEYLHGCGLIHRDIKPSNIIFAAGIPKLADVGLVTEMAGDARVLTYVGTEGYIPPEGPGTSAGDVYSLGKVFYEASMGRDRMQYPDLPTSVMEGPPDSDLLRLNEMILKACESDPKRRYRSASELLCDLLPLQKELQTRAGKPG